MGVGAGGESRAERRAAPIHRCSPPAQQSGVRKGAEVSTLHGIGVRRGSARHHSIPGQLSVHTTREAAHRAAAIRIDHSEDGLFVLKTALHLLVVDELAEAVEVHLLHLFLDFRELAEQRHAHGAHTRRIHVRRLHRGNTPGNLSRGTAHHRRPRSMRRQERRPHARSGARAQGGRIVRGGPGEKSEHIRPADP